MAEEKEPDLEAQFERQAKARAAQMLRGILADRLVDQEHSIITNLLNKHGQGTLTSEDLFAGIGGIAELRRLLSTLEVDIRRGQSDG